MKLFKLIVYFIFTPVVTALMAWVYLVYGKDSKTFGWYQRGWQKKGFSLKIILILVSPFILIPVGILYFLHKPWEKLIEN